MSGTDSWDTAPIRTVLCDLDGVIWLAHEPLPGAVEAIEQLQGAGCRIVFVTNNSAATLAEHREALATIGIDIDRFGTDIVSSALAAARLVDQGAAVLACAGPGVVVALEARGAVVTRTARGQADPAPSSPGSRRFDAVVVGLHLDFDYYGLGRAVDALRHGARFIATNEDPTYPTPTGAQPGAGSIVAAVSTAAGCKPEVAGKPHQPMVDIVTELLGDSFDPLTTVMIGDRRSTDGGFAERLRCRFVHIETNVEEIHDGGNHVIWRGVEHLQQFVITDSALFGR
jgi:glycerol 3-phosphatase-2